MAFGPTLRRTKRLQAWLYAKGEFRYNPEKDAYVCPAGELLRRAGRREWQGRQVPREGLRVQRLRTLKGRPDLNRDTWLSESHRRWYYHRDVMPWNWINYEGDEF